MSHQARRHPHRCDIRDARRGRRAAARALCISIALLLAPTVALAGPAKKKAAAVAPTVAPEPVDPAKQAARALTAIADGDPRALARAASHFSDDVVLGLLAPSQSALV